MFICSETLGDESMGLMSNSDYEYLRQNNVVDFDKLQQSEHVETPAEYVSPLNSGNVQSNASSSKILHTPVAHLPENQIQYVQFPADSSTLLNSPGSASGELSSAMQNMHLLNAESKQQLINDPFEILGTANVVNINVDEITKLAIVDANGVPMQIPVQVLTGKESDECAIHVLSLTVEEKKEEQNLQISPETHVKITEDNIAFHEPCRTSTPAGQIDALNDTIVAGHTFHPTPILQCDYSENPIETSPDSMSSPQSTSDEQKENLGMNSKKTTTTVTTAEIPETGFKARKKRNKALNYMTQVSKKPRIAVIQEEAEDDVAKQHLEPNEKVHNETYCRDWVKTAQAETSVSSVGNATFENAKSVGARKKLFAREQAQNDFDSSPKKSTKTCQDLMGLDSVSQNAQNAQTSPEVNKKRSTSVLSSLSRNVKEPENAAKNTMYVHF